MIGILGGTFDPIHLGHLHIANQVSRQLNLDQVQFMPCAQPVHRGAPQGSAKHRCDMIELAIEGDSKFSLSRVEVDRDGPSYSVDSLRIIQQQSGARLAIIMGVDAFNGFAQWKAPEAILKLANLIVCHRPGYLFDAEIYPDYRVDSLPQFQQSAAGAILTIEAEPNDCSSSQVRRDLSSYLKTNDCVTSSVATYIQAHQLYRS